MPVGFTKHRTAIGYTFAKTALMNYDDLRELTSASSLIDHHIRMHQYDSNCSCQTNWFNLAGTPSRVFEPEPLNTVESVDTLLAATFEEEPLEACSWEQSTVPSPWNTYSTDAGREGGGLDSNNPLFGPHWTRYTGAHFWFPCDPEETCDCEGHNCAVTHSTIGHAAAAATTA